MGDFDGLDLDGVHWPLKERDVPLGSTLTLSNDRQRTRCPRLARRLWLAFAYPEIDPNDCTELHITGVGRRGDGIARHGGCSGLHSPNPAGETVQVDNRRRARVSRIVTPSPDRVAAFCQHYETCGGCQLQHWRDEPYRVWKAGLVESPYGAGALSNRP